MLAQRQSESRSGYIEVKTRQRKGNLRLNRVALTLKKSSFRPALGRVVSSCLEPLTSEYGFTTITIRLKHAPSSRLRRRRTRIKHEHACSSASLRKSAANISCSACCFALL
jgi:hypothetical protein